MKIKRNELKSLFIRANNSFLTKNSMLFESKVSERTLCGALMIELSEEIKKSDYSGYYVDVEYNRNKGSIKLGQKTMINKNGEIVTINCDLLVHSRGQKDVNDNLIALEMKKSTAKKEHKEKDKMRVACLTVNPNTNEIYPNEGKLPEHVCGYKLGIYYEINYGKETILIEYYSDGEKYNECLIDFTGREFPLNTNGIV